MLTSLERRMMAGVLMAAAGTAMLPRTAQALDIMIEGTGDGMEILQALSGQFNTLNPGDRAIIPPSIGSGAGIAKVIDGTNPLARSARPLTSRESAGALTAAAVARIPSAIIAHPAIKLPGLKADQLLAIYAGDITNWNEVGGPDLRIRVHTREDEDSTLSALRATMPGWKSLKITNKARVITTTTQDLLKAIIETPGAIGYAPHSQLASQRLTTLAIDGHKPLDKGYPSAVTVSLVWKTGAIPAPAAAFVTFARSIGVRETIASLGATPAAP